MWFHENNIYGLSKNVCPTVCIMFDLDNVKQSFNRRRGCLEFPTKADEEISTLVKRLLQNYGNKCFTVDNQIVVPN